MIRFPASLYRMLGESFQSGKTKGGVSDDRPIFSPEGFSIEGEKLARRGNKLSYEQVVPGNSFLPRSGCSLLQPSKADRNAFLKSSRRCIRFLQ